MLLINEIITPEEFLTGALAKPAKDGINEEVYQHYKNAFLALYEDGTDPVLTPHTIAGSVAILCAIERLLRQKKEKANVAAGN